MCSLSDTSLARSGFQICGFCYHEISASVNPSCPSCRAKYKKNKIEFTTPSDAELAARIKAKRDNMKRSKKKIGRASLAQVRVLQRNLLYVTNLPVECAKEELLARPEYFGQYGKIRKIAINNRVPPTGAAAAAAAAREKTKVNSASAYVTFANEKGHDAYNAILACDGAMLGGRQIKVAFGTTKYCSLFLREVECTNKICMYLHEVGAPEDSFSKEDMAAGKHLLRELPVGAPPPTPYNGGPDFRPVLPVAGTNTRQLLAQGRGGGGGGGSGGAALSTSREGGNRDGGARQRNSRGRGGGGGGVSGATAASGGVSVQSGGGNRSATQSTPQAALSPRRSGLQASNDSSQQRDHSDARRQPRPSAVIAPAATAPVSSPVASSSSSSSSVDSVRAVAPQQPAATPAVVRPSGSGPFDFAWSYTKPDRILNAFQFGAEGGRGEDMPRNESVPFDTEVALQQAALLQRVCPAAAVSFFVPRGPGQPMVPVASVPLAQAPKSEQ